MPPKAKKDGGAPDMITLKRVSKQRKPENWKGEDLQSFPLDQALAMLRSAAKSSVPTWKIAHEGYTFKNNEIISTSSDKSN
jgi:hypothetical protein